MEKTYKILKLLIWVLALAVVIVGAYVLYGRLSSQMEPGELATVAQESTAAQTRTAKTAPDFTVYDGEGNPVRLSDFRGKGVVLNFWASWCGPCTSEMPDMEAAFQEYGEELQFLMVNLTDGSQETVASASGFIEEQGYTFPVYYDTDMDAAMAYGISAIPMTYFIDEEGSAAAYYQGAMSAEVLQQGIEKLLAGE